MSEEVAAALGGLRDALPKGVTATVVQDRGRRAEKTVGEGAGWLFLGVFVVFLLMTASLGWRDALAAFLPVPAALSITLFLGMISGGTLGRVPLVALTVAAGLCAAAPVAVMLRIRSGYQGQAKVRLQPTLDAVAAAGMPVAVSAAAAALALLPLVFLPGPVGRYLRPLPLYAVAALGTSVFAAFVLTPWAAYRLWPC